MTVFSVSIPSLRRKSDKARLEAAKNLDDTHRRLVLPARPAERIRPSHGGFVQYYSPDDVGRSSSSSSASEPSSLNPTPTSACSQFGYGKQQSEKADKASTKKGPFSSKGGRHPDCMYEAEDSWRGEWPESEHTSEWQAPLKPAKRAFSWSSTSTSDSASSFGTARPVASITGRTQSFSNPSSASDSDPVWFVGCQEFVPGSPVSFYSAAWDHLPRNDEPPLYALMPRYA